MSYFGFNRNYHTRGQIIKGLLWYLTSFLRVGRMPKKGLVVLNYHGTPEKFQQEFVNQLIWFNQHFHILAPSEIDKFYDGQLNSIDQPCLLFCFDDGIKNNLLAAEVLESFRIKGLFFVVPEFIDTLENQQSHYHKYNIRPKINPHITSQPEDTRAMSWKDLKSLFDKGHEIGSHTYTHTLNNTEYNNIILDKEIVESKYVIEKKLSLEPNTVRHFCGPFNTLKSINNHAMKLISEHYTYHFTGYPGCNINPRLPLHIQRINIETHWTIEMVKFALTNIDWLRWRKEQKLFVSNNLSLFHENY